MVLNFQFCPFCGKTDIKASCNGVEGFPEIIDVHWHCDACRVGGTTSAISKDFLDDDEGWEEWTENPTTSTVPKLAN